MRFEGRGKRGGRAGGLLPSRRRQVALRANRRRQERAGRFKPAGSQRLPVAYSVVGREIQEEKAMSKVANSIRRGLGEAVAHAEGKADESAYRVHVPVKID